MDSVTSPEALMAQFARNLANKFMHTPTSRLKEASADGNHEVVSAFNRLFDLDEPSSSKKQIDSTRCFGQSLPLLPFQETSPPVLLTVLLESLLSKL